MSNKLHYNDKTSKLRAVLIYAAAIIIDFILASKLEKNTPTDAIIIFCVIVDFVFVFYAGAIFRAPVFGKMTQSVYKSAADDSRSEGTKAADAEILSKLYGYSEGESRLIVEQRETNRLLEEQNKLLNDKSSDSKN